MLVFLAFTNGETKMVYLSSASNLEKIVGPHDSIKPRQVSPVWKNLPANWQIRLEELVSQCAERTPKIFFRADNIGAGGSAFRILLALFNYYKIPLALAVVPAWMSIKRLETFRAYTNIEDPLWDWHQHGWRHLNWNRGEKKAEFSATRTREQQWNDILKGKKKLEQLFNTGFVPVFSPPWNRLDIITLGVLQQLDFSAVSMDCPIPRGAKYSIRLKNFRIYLDLHARKTKNPEFAYDELLRDMEEALDQKGYVGIMINHQKMNLSAFDFLQQFLHLVRSDDRIKIVSFREMLRYEEE